MDNKRSVLKILESLAILFIAINYTYSKRIFLIKDENGQLTKGHSCINIKFQELVNKKWPNHVLILTDASKLSF